MTIWKYPLTITDRQVIEMPKYARLLSIQMQLGIPCLWASVDEAQPLKEGRIIRIVGTGHAIQDWHRLDYIGTIQEHRQAPDGRHYTFVWHVFDGGTE